MKPSVIVLSEAPLLRFEERAIEGHLRVVKHSDKGPLLKISVVAVMVNEVFRPVVPLKRGIYKGKSCIKNLMVDISEVILLKGGVVHI